MLTNRTRVDGKFLGPGGVVPSSQAICSSLLEECFEIAQEIKATEDSKNVASSLKPIYDRLSEIRAELESLVMTHRWSLRETDLWNYSLSLQEIDKMRVDGKFVDSEGDRPSGQYVGVFSCLHPALISLPAECVIYDFACSYLCVMLITSIHFQGLVVPAATVLWFDISTTVCKRTCLGRTHADSTNSFQMFTVIYNIFGF